MNALDKIRARWYDFIHNVETRTVVPLAGLNVVGENKSLGYAYFPMLPKTMHGLLRRVDGMLDKQDATFIDIGSGKGIALLVSSLYPFKKIVGVEFSSDLTRIAERNLRNYHGSQACKDIEIKNLDAVDYEFPDGPLLVYFFNPFDKKVMERVLQNLTKALNKQQRNVVVICDRLHEKGLVAQYLRP